MANSPVLSIRLKRDVDELLNALVDAENAQLRARGNSARTGKAEIVTAALVALARSRGLLPPSDEPAPPSTMRVPNPPPIEPKASKPRPASKASQPPAVFTDDELRSAVRKLIDSGQVLPATLWAAAGWDAGSGTRWLSETKRHDGHLEAITAGRRSKLVAHLRKAGALP